MVAHKWSDDYELAIANFERHIRFENGIFVLVASDGPSIGIDDAVIFADLKRSLDVTNQKIRDGEIDSNSVLPFADAISQS